MHMTLTGSHGDELSARLDLPTGAAQAFAIVAHCFTCSKESAAATQVAVALTEAGFGVLRFDFTGLGGSEGEFANTGFSSNVDDLIAAADWLAEHHSAPQLLVGHSLGGAAALVAAPRIASVKAVATIGAPSDPAHVEGLLTGAVDVIEQQGEAEVCLAGRPFTVRRQFLHDIRMARLTEALTALRAAVLILHSPIDELVSIDHAAALYQAARHPKSFVTLDGADHLLTNRADGAYAGRMIATWAGRYVEPEHPPLPVPATTAPVVVAETGQGTFLNHVVAGGHRFLADEPLAVGGSDAGPSPYDLLAAALGACTSMTLRLYADRKSMPLQRVTVEVSHGKIHAADCTECAEGRTGMIDRFARTLRLDGELTDADRAKLAEIADRCPVHRTLEASSVITTQLA